MNVNGVGYISARYTKNDYKGLNLTLNSNCRVWKFAIEIFTDRWKNDILIL